MYTNYDYRVANAKIDNWVREAELIRLLKSTRNQRPEEQAAPVIVRTISATLAKAGQVFLRASERLEARYQQVIDCDERFDVVEGCPGAA